MSKIHLVMQGKGGVGKSLLAFYLAQYVKEKNGKCLAIDTDPLNQTLARTAALEAKVVRILADDHITIMKNAFDLMIEECEAEDADVVIDVGASSFAGCPANC
jgi:CO dehydrogenase nickel-insertion accessory protein CooC1